MKRVVSWAAIILTALAMGGCPVFPDSSGCFSDRDCAPGYSCNLATGACLSGTGYGYCTQPSACGVNETCDKTGTCRLGDCSVANIGCVSGYTCEIQNGVWACVPASSVPDASLGYGGASGASAGAAGASGSSQGGTSGAAGAQAASGGASGSGGSTNAGGAAGATIAPTAGASGMAGAGATGP
ncbi:MAG TPA: hypothetical protein VGJ84_24275 [Polyangiaceae bacterium]|jgi:hypothetical protein